MGVQRAVVVDRDPAVLARLSAELGQSGYAVETLASTIGLTPDLLELSEPDLLLLDAELPGLERPTLLVLARSIRSRRQLRIILSTEKDAEGLAKQIPADRVLGRAELLSKGASALGLEVSAAPELDLRALLDRVLGRPGAGNTESLEVRVDLFSKNNVYVVAGKKEPAGVFYACTALLPLGQKVSLELSVLARPAIKLFAEVAWHRPHSSFGGRLPTGIGLRFAGLAATDSAALAGFLEVREPVVGPA